MGNTVEVRVLSAAPMFIVDVCMALPVWARRAQWQVADFPEPGPHAPFRSIQQCRGIDGGGLRKRPRPRGRGKPRPKPGEVSLRNGLTIAAVLTALARLLLLLAGLLLRILALLAALVLHGVLLCPLAWR